MPGSTNQIQTPFGTGVRTALALAANAAGGLSLTPTNPNISYTGTWLSGFQFSLYNAAVINNAGFTSYLLSATFDDGLQETGLLTLSLGNIQQINGAFSPTMAALTSFSAPSLINITGASTPNFALATTFSFPNLAYVNGNFNSSLASMVSLSFPSLIYVNGAFGATGASITTLSAPNLVAMTGNFSPSLAALTTLTLTSLTTASSCNPTMNALTTFSLPALVTLTGTFSPVMGACTSVSVPNLATWAGGSPTFNVLTTLSFPAVVSVGNNITITAANLVTFSFGSTLKAIIGNVTMSGMKLNQASVDGILVSLAALDGTNGTTAWSSRTVNVSGGTSSAPSATGLAAKATLQARLCTVTTN